VLKKKIRSTDIAARLGGDEFAVLFPESDYSHSQEALEKLHNDLLCEMQKHDWQVTFSIGAITFLNVIPGFDNLLAQTDTMMYEIKHNGKACLKHMTIS